MKLNFFSNKDALYLSNESKNICFYMKKKNSCPLELSINQTIQKKCFSKKY